MKTALITAVGGQDGSFMAEHLLSLGYRVVGTVRRHPRCIRWLSGNLNRIELVYADVRDMQSLESAVRKAWPDEVYNFAGLDNIDLCNGQPEETMNVIFGGFSRIMSLLKTVKPNTRVYQASSAAMFGKANGACNEESPSMPDNPYAIAKNAAHQLAGSWRQRGMHVSCGICFNHESERRGGDRASVKIANAAAKWAMGSDDPLVFGNQDAKRDWGYAPDFVKAMHLMLQQDEPGDYVLGSGETRSVRDFIRAACNAAGFANIPDHLITKDQMLVRANDTRVMLANPTKAKEQLGWKTETDFQQIAELMVNAEVDRLKGVVHAETIGNVAVS